MGLVSIGGQQKPAIRVQVDPQALANRGIGLEDVRNVLAQANVDLPKGTLNSPQQTYTLNTNDQLIKADPYNDLIVAYRNGSPVRIRDIGKAIEGPENNLLAGWYNGQRAIILGIQRQPGANVIATVDGIKSLLPQLQASIPPAIKINVVSDRTQTIRASVDDVRFTLMLTVGLVVMVIFLFLRNFWATDHSRDNRAAFAHRHLRRAVRDELQPRQPLPDGALGRDRFRRGRRCGGDREHRAACRSRPQPHGSGSQGVQRDRVHRSFPSRCRSLPFSSRCS